MQSIVAAGRTLVVSPHLDDAVLSCGALMASLPDVTVFNVFAGMPQDIGRLTDYDRQCGFTSAGQAVRTRLAEDGQALARLGAQALYAQEIDSQYAPLPDIGALGDRLAPVLMDSQWDTVMLPFGLFHCDHERASDACLHVACRVRGSRWANWLLYEDVPYRRRLGVMQCRLATLAGRGWIVAPAAVEGSGGIDAAAPMALAKHEALACYGSQLKTLGLLHGGDQHAPERFWSLIVGATA